jgi:hypothetical protein
MYMPTAGAFKSSEIMRAVGDGYPQPSPSSAKAEKTKPDRAIYELLHHLRFFNWQYKHLFKALFDSETGKSIFRRQLSSFCPSYARMNLQTSSFCPSYARTSLQTSSFCPSYARMDPQISGFFSTSQPWTDGKFSKFRLSMTWDCAKISVFCPFERWDGSGKDFSASIKQACKIDVPAAPALKPCPVNMLNNYLLFR